MFQNWVLICWENISATWHKSDPMLGVKKRQILIFGANWDIGSVSNVYNDIFGSVNNHSVICFDLLRVLIDNCFSQNQF